MRRIKILLGFLLSFGASYAQLGKVQENGFDNRREPSILGTQYNKGSFTTPDLADFTNNGGGTPSISGTSISVTAGTTGTLTESLDITKVSYTNLYYWTYTTYHKANYTPTSTTFGGGPGFRSYVTAAAASVECHLNTSTDLTFGNHLLIQTPYPTTTLLASSVGTLSWSSGDEIVTTLERRGVTLFATCWNATTNSAPIFATYTYSLLYTGIINPNPPNAGMFGFFQLGGNQLIDSINIYSKEITNPFILTGADSKTVGFYDSTKNGWVYQIMRSWPNIVNFAGGGNTTALFDSLMPLIIRMHPKYLLVETGTNDGSWATTKPGITDIYNRAIANGITPLFMRFYQNGNLAAWDSLQVNFPNNIINAYNVTKQLGALSPDSVHESSLGDSLIAKVVLESGRFLGGATAYSNLLNYLGGGGGGSGSTPSWDATLTVNPATAQSPQITGYKTTGYGLLIGDITIQPFASNTALIGHNTNLNSTSKYINTGAAEVFQLAGGQILPGVAPSGTAGATIPYVFPLKIDYTGTVDLGGNASGAFGTHTGVAMSISPTSLTIANASLPNTGAITDSILTITSAGIVKVLEQSGAVAGIPVWASTGFKNFAGLTYTSGTETFQVASSGSSASRGIVNTQNSTNVNAPSWFSRKSEGTLTSPTAVTSGDFLMALQPQGYDGTTYVTAGLIGFVTNGTIATNSVPTDFIIQTGVLNSGNERVRIKSTGNVLIGQTGDSSATLQIIANTASNALMWLKGSTVSMLAGNRKPGMLNYFTSRGAGNDSLNFVESNGTVVNLLASGGGSQTLQQVLTTGSTLTGTNTITNTGQTLNFTGGIFKYNGILSGVGTPALFGHGADSSLDQLAVGDGLSISSGIINTIGLLYTPTLTNTTNISSSTAGQSSYMRAGSIVHVSVGGLVTPTLISTSSILTISLPITSTSVGSQGNTGVGVIVGATGNAVGIINIPTATTATLTFFSLGTSSTTFSGQFDYWIQ